ncbi:DUF2169 family type VI secretion system accessory protein [Methylobacterium fujisawaense]|uniref:DUF2169 family type VI secretion system accessory protein n=1 Tax=Methylobacterium fujisawaense TaxID=107400 RepID=UPI00313AAF99
MRDRNGFEHWVVALRATFTIQDDGPVAINERQEPPYLAPRYVDRAAQELHSEADIAPFRPKVDLTIHGNAVARDHKTFKSLPFSVRVGAMTKQAIAFGHRQISKHNESWRLDRYDPVASVPLSWRNALGGEDLFGLEQCCPYNPIGMGWSTDYARAENNSVVILPHIENAQERIGRLDKPPAPMGFCPLQPAWRPRIDHAGTYDAQWEHSRAPLVPSDFSEQFHQAAPPDQILALNGGEPVEIVGLHPAGAYRFALPQIIIDAKTLINGEKPLHRLRLVGVHIDATEKKLSMVWNGSLPCNGIEHTIDLSVVRVKQMAGVQR